MSISQILHHYLKLKYNRCPIFLFAEFGNPTQNVEITTNLPTLHPPWSYLPY